MFIFQILSVKFTVFILTWINITTPYSCNILSQRCFCVLNLLKTSFVRYERMKCFLYVMNVIKNVICMLLMSFLNFHSQICLIIAWACMIDYHGGLSGLHSRNSFFLGVNISAWVFVVIWFIGYLFMLCNEIKLSNKMFIVSIFSTSVELRIWQCLSVCLKTLGQAAGFKNCVS